MKKTRLDILRSNTVIFGVNWEDDERWETVGYFETVEEKKEVYARADAIKGYLRVVDVETGNLIFGRNTTLIPRPASDDCHTYS